MDLLTKLLSKKFNFNYRLFPDNAKPHSNSKFHLLENFIFQKKKFLYHIKWMNRSFPEKEFMRNIISELRKF